MRVLIVEDETIVALNMEDSLSEAGHSILGIARTWSSAMEFARAERPDLALVDMNLADETSGIVVAAQLRQQFNVPTIFVTANPDRDLGPLAGALGCLTKPFSDSELALAVDAAASVISSQKPRRLPPNLELYR